MKLQNGKFFQKKWTRCSHTFGIHILLIWSWNSQRAITEEVTVRQEFVKNLDSNWRTFDFQGRLSPLSKEFQKKWIRCSHTFGIHTLRIWSWNSQRAITEEVTVRQVFVKKLGSNWRNIDFQERFSPLSKEFQKKWTRCSHTFTIYILRTWSWNSQRPITEEVTVRQVWWQFWVQTQTSKSHNFSTSDF